MKTQNTVLNSVLEQTVDFRADVLKQQIAWVEKMSNRKCTKRDIEHMEICMIHDLAKSIGKYVVDTDVLVGEWSVLMDCGKLTISASIERDGIVYPFATDVIFAGGYNIQCYHIRYIVKGGLSRIGTMEDAKAINEVIKKMKKEDRIMEDIAFQQRFIAKSESYIIGNDDLSDEQLFDLFIVQAYENGADDKSYTFTSAYNFIIGRYTYSNLNEFAMERYTAASYDAEKLSDIWDDAVVKVRKEIIRLRSCIKSCDKKIAKLQQKLELLEQAA